MPPDGGVEVFVFQGSKFLGSRCFSQTTIVVGSASNATLKLRGKGIQPEHALIRVEGTSVLVADKSHGGVEVNRQRISMQAVKSFDEITIGPFRLKISLLGHEDEEDAGFGANPDPHPHTSPRDPSRPAERHHDDDRLDEDAQTVVRHVSSLGDSGEATMPRIDPRAAATRHHRRADHDDDGEYGEDLLEKGDRGLSHRDRSRSQRDEDAPQHHDRSRSDGPGSGPSRSSQRSPAYDETELAARVEARRDRSVHGDRSDREDDLDPRSATEDQEPRRNQRTSAAPEDPYSKDPYNERDEAPPTHAQAQESLADASWASGDDDDDDEPFVESFSLLENVVRERFKDRAETEGGLLAEVIRYGDGEILDVLQAAPGRAVKLFPDDFKLIDTLGNGHARLYFKKGFSGNVVRKGKARRLTRLLRQETLVDPKRGIHAIDLQEGDYAQIVREDAGYLVRFVHPPKVPKAKLLSGFSLAWSTVQIFAGSMAFHFLILVLLGFTAPNADLVIETDAEKFAKVALKDLKLEKPEKKEEKKEPPKPEKVKDKPKKPTKKPPPTKRKVTRQQTARPTRQVSPKQQAKVQKKQVSQVLSALQNLKPTGGAGHSSLKSLTTNIKAIRLPGGSSGGFKVSGVIGKIAGNSVRLASGGFGSGGKGTRVGRQLLAGGKIGRIAAIKGTGTRVRGRVRRAPTRSIRASGGVLSRAAIQKVVSAHMNRVQACYERQLLTSPGLSGKIVFDWVITTSGSVGSARQVSSSLRSAAVASCILREIRKWRFPHPVGGSVNVRYPFVFRVQGF